MDESPDHKPTLIERGMGVHLNNPIAAQRGTRNSRPARSELRKPHPPSCGGTAKGRTNKSESPPRLPRTGPGSGARRKATPPGYAPNARKRQHMRMAPPRPAETNASHDDDAAEKTLKECTHSSKASGVKDRYGEPETGGSEWELIKILLEGDGDSNKTNTASNTRLRLTTQVGQAHVATGVPLDLGTNTQPSEPKHTNTHSGNLHGLLPVLHRSD
jgi:hypothetical protein